MNNYDLVKQAVMEKLANKAKAASKAVTKALKLKPSEAAKKLADTPQHSTGFFAGRGRGKSKYPKTENFLEGPESF